MSASLVDDGYPTVPVRDATVAAMLTSVTQDSTVDNSEVARIAATVGVPAEAFPVVLAAVTSLADDASLETDGVRSALTLVSGPSAPALGFSAGYSALGGATGINAAVGRAIAAALRRIAPVSEQPRAISQPGTVALVASERDDAPWPTTAGDLDAGLAVLTGVVTGVRGAYAGGGRSDPDLVAGILGDSLRVALINARPAPRVAMVAVSPQTADLIDRSGGRGAFAERLLDVIRADTDAEVTAALDIAIVCLGGESQVWCSLAMGAPGSRWHRAEVQ